MEYIFTQFELWITFVCYGIVVLFFMEMYLVIRYRFFSGINDKKMFKKMYGKKYYIPCYIFFKTLEYGRIQFISKYYFKLDENKYKEK